jgi:two-component system sensor histidine kinase/response regulator
VQDTGIGMNAEQLQRVLNPFTQADSSTTRRYGGTGLGLSITQRLVELMGGQLNIHSELGSGSTFSFTAVFRGGPTSLSVSRVRSGMQVLLVEDSEPQRRALGRLLLAANCTVDSASSAQDALRNLEGRMRFGVLADAVLVDRTLPDMDGVRLAQQIASNPGLAGVAVILMDQPSSTFLLGNEARKRGLSAVLSKPVGRAALLRVLSKVAHDERTSTIPPRLEPTLTDVYILRGKTVLLAQDNEVSREVARELLESVGMKVQVASNGVEAVRYATTTSIDAVLMDLHMPLMDGVEAARAIRCHPRSADIQIIAMTASGLAEDRERCLGAGMNAHVSTPIEPSRLFSVLAGFIGVSRTNPFAS